MFPGSNSELKECRLLICSLPRSLNTSNKRFSYCAPCRGPIWGAEYRGLSSFHRGCFSEIGVIGLLRTIQALCYALQRTLKAFRTFKRWERQVQLLIAEDRIL
jgi:hypothetical protein